MVVFRFGLCQGPDDREWNNIPRSEEGEAAVPRDMVFEIRHDLSAFGCNPRSPNLVVPLVFTGDAQGRAVAVDKPRRCCSPHCGERLSVCAYGTAHFV